MELAFTHVIVIDVGPEAELLEEFAVRVLVAGTTELPYGNTFRARFGTEPFEAAARDMHGTGITGYLRNEPAEGATLFVEFNGQDEIETGFVYTRGPGA